MVLVLTIKYITSPNILFVQVPDHVKTNLNKISDTYFLKRFLAFSVFE